MCHFVRTTLDAVLIITSAPISYKGIFQILFLRPQIEMLDIYTRGIIAMMENV